MTLFDVKRSLISFHLALGLWEPLCRTLAAGRDVLEAYLAETLWQWPWQAKVVNIIPVAEMGQWQVAGLGAFWFCWLCDGMLLVAGCVTACVFVQQSQGNKPVLPKLSPRNPDCLGCGDRSPFELSSASISPVIELCHCQLRNLWKVQRRCCRHPELMQIRDKRLRQQLTMKPKVLCLYCLACAVFVLSCLCFGV